MPHNLTESDSFDADVTVPDDSIDPRSATTVEVPFQAVTNRTRWAHNRLTGAQPIADDLVFTGTPSFDGGADFNDPVTFDDDVTFSDPVTFNDDVTVAGDTEFTGQVALENITNLEERMVCSGVGRVRQRIVTGVDADHTYTINDTSIVFIPVLTGNRSYTIGSTGAANGDQITFIWDESGSNVVQLYQPDGVTTIVVMGGGGTEHLGVILTWHGSTWRPTARWKN